MNFVTRFAAKRFAGPSKSELVDPAWKKQTHWRLLATGILGTPYLLERYIDRTPGHGRPFAYRVWLLQHRDPFPWGIPRRPRCGLLRVWEALEMGNQMRGGPRHEVGITLTLTALPRSQTGGL